MPRVKRFGTHMYDPQYEVKLLQLVRWGTQNPDFAAQFAIFEVLVLFIFTWFEMLLVSGAHEESAPTPNGLLCSINAQNDFGSNAPLSNNRSVDPGSIER